MIKSIKLSTLEVSFYIFLLLIIAGFEFEYFLNSKNILNYFRRINSPFSENISELLNSILLLLYLSIPSIFIISISIRIHRLNHLTIASICNSLIALVLFNLVTTIQVHNFWFDPNILDLILNILNSSSSKISALDSISSTFSAFFSIALIIILYIPIIVYFILIIKNLKMEKFLGYSLYFYLFLIFSIGLILLSHKLTVKIFFENLVFDLDNKSLFEFEFALSLLSAITFLYIYFKYIAYYLSHLILEPFSENFIENNWVKINMLYIVLIILINIGLREANINLSMPPSKFRGEIPKSKNEIENQIDRNLDYYESNHR